MGVVIGAALGGILLVVLAVWLFRRAYFKKVQVVSKCLCSSLGIGLKTLA